MKNDGGAAFPISYEHNLGNSTTKSMEWQGMSLRDYFAAAALQGILANTSGRAMEWRIKQSWIIADSMIKEREK